MDVGALESLILDDSLVNEIEISESNSAENSFDVPVPDQTNGQGDDEDEDPDDTDTEYESVEDDLERINQKCIFYTGLEDSLFQSLCKVFEIKFGNHSVLDMSLADQLFLFFMRLRRAFFFEDLAFRFRITKRAASEIFAYWLPKAASLFSQLVRFLPVEESKQTMPTAFKQQSPQTTCVLYETEVVIRKRVNLPAQGKFIFTNYKKHTTAKFMVAITPDGYNVFVTGAYRAAASAKYIVKSSGFLDALKPNMEILAEQTYSPIRSEIEERGCTLKTPAFNGPKLTSTVRKKHTASIQKHIDKAKARLRSFSILDHEYNASTARLLDDIIICCAGLANVQYLYANNKMDELSLHSHK